MDREKRKGTSQIPKNLNDILNKAQLQALSGIKHAGWELLFLRRPLFQEPVLVVHNPKDNTTGIFDKDGKIIIQPNFKKRELENLIQSPQPINPLVWTK